MAPLAPLVLLLLLADADAETERLLLGPNPFFRREGMERAVRARDEALLLRAAGSPHWDARVFAATGLGAATPLALLDDPVAAVREAAVKALDLAAPLPHLAKLASDPDDSVRAAAAWALRGAKRPSLLAPLARDPWPSVRAAACAARGDFSRLREAADGGDLGEAVVALAAIARGGGPAEGAWLLAKLERALARAAKEPVPLFWRDEPGPDMALARALGEIARRGVDAGGKPLSERIGKLVRDAKLGACGASLLAEAAGGARHLDAAHRILDAHLQDRVTSMLADAQLNEVLRATLHGFARDGWHDLGPLLGPYLDHRDALVRVDAAKVLRGEAAVSALAHSDPGVRAAAAANVDRTAALLPLAEDPSPAVARACARRLGRLGGPDAAAGLARLFRHPLPEVRRAAAAASMRVDGDGREAALYALAIGDPDLPVREAAATALSALDLEGPIERALADLTHADRGVRAAAKALLERLTPARHPFDPAQPEAGAAVWRGWWSEKGRRDHAPDAFRYHVEDLRRRGLDLVVCVDATGSMASTIQGTKRRIEEVVSILRAIVLDVRVRIVAYRDRGDCFVAIGSPLTHDGRVLEDFLACLPASGGGDFEEAVFEGLREATTGTRFRPKSQRVVVLFGDAPPHPNEIALVEATAREFKGVVNAVDVGGGRAADAFRAIATAGRGACVASPDGGDDDDLLRDLLVLALGAEHRAIVELLLE